MKLETLRLPTFDYKIKEIKGKNCIFDVIRKKFLILTPEEWVRQHFIHLLINQFNYPKSLFRIEGGLRYNQLQKRSDILVYNAEGNPFLLVECKAAEVAINQAVIEQVTRYNLTIKAQFIVITNGINTFCFEADWAKNSYRQVQSIPLI
ncbi:MAG: type I restriction enzyme HsdR N-terminal domain-containing protein [Spirosomaceae bacterium]|jgi:hypothetical protein|nr:type I restriction enzyme HsdR N-terminal domain-containing protein [Spirosomataceae bacterium]